MNSVIDNLYCINLPQSTERREASQVEFDKHGLDVQFFDAVDGDLVDFDDLEQFPNSVGSDMLDQYKALNQSIINVLTDALLNGYKSIIIFEDDIVFEDNISDTFIEAFNDLPKWVVLYLGVLSTFATPKIKGRLHCIFHGVFGHAVAINTSNRDYVDSLIERLEKMDLESDLCIAQCYKSLEGVGAFAILPSIAKQLSGYSTILKCIVSEKDYS